jgi:hypothetical protein
MSKLLSSLLETDRRDFETIIARLEHMTIGSGVDNRLSAEIVTQAREKSSRLGLDPSDSTREELYFSLLAKAQSDGQAVRKKLDISEATKPHKTAEKIAVASEKLLKKERVVCMQPPAIKRLLKALPPKKTLRALNYRSIDSVLKRENPMLLYALANRIEDKTWHTQLQARLKRLQARDVKECSVQVLSLPEVWLDKLKKHEFNNVVQPVPEIGCLLILPTVPLHLDGAVLLTVSLVLQAGQRMGIDALQYRTKALRVGVETLIPDIAAGVLQELSPIHGLQPNWPAVYQLLAEQTKHRLPDFEFVLNDLNWESTETRLSILSTELDFWVNSHYLGTSQDEERPVSFHIIDVVGSLVMKKQYGEHITSHLRASLWNELQLRYMKHESLENAVISQLTMTQNIVL